MGGAGRADPERDAAPRPRDATGGGQREASGRRCAGRVPAGEPEVPERAVPARERRRRLGCGRGSGSGRRGRCGGRRRRNGRAVGLPARRRRCRRARRRARRRRGSRPRAGSRGGSRGSSGSPAVFVHASGIDELRSELESPDRQARRCSAYSSQRHGIAHVPSGAKAPCSTATATASSISAARRAGGRRLMMLCVPSRRAKRS